MQTDHARTGARIIAGVAACVMALGSTHAAADDKARALAAAYNASGHDLYRALAGKEKGNLVLSPFSIGTAMAMALAGARGSTEAEMASVLKHSLDKSGRDDAAVALARALESYREGCPGKASQDAAVKGDPQAPADAGPGGRGADAATPGDAAAAAAPNAKDGSRERPADGRESAERRADLQSPAGAADRAGAAAETGTAERKVACLKLSTANALFLATRGDVISERYAALLDAKYGARLFRDARLEDINGFVKEKTEGRIGKLLDRLDKTTAAVLVNAVYFKGLWAKPFDKDKTRDGEFRLSATASIEVPMMHRQDGYQTASGPGWQAIRLPYHPASVGLVIVLPDEVDGAMKGNVLDAAQQAQLLATLQSADERPIDLTLPRFKIEAGAELVEPFRELGMKLAFDDIKADFSGMTELPAGNPPLSIGQIAHRAMIDVSEEGTEAAAATAVVMLQRSYKPRPEPDVFRVDRPFLFLIVDDATGAVLFTGRVADPRGDQNREATAPGQR